MILGIDFGNVIRDNETKQEIPGVKDALRQLKMLFQDRIYVVSRVDDDANGERNLKYLKDNYFIPDFVPSDDHVIFCRNRMDKGPICDDLRITHFVDDRTECLRFMPTVPNRYALNPTPEQLMTFPPLKIKVCKSWFEIVSLIQSGSVNQTIPHHA